MKQYKSSIIIIIIIIIIISDLFVCARDLFVLALFYVETCHPTSGFRYDHSLISISHSQVAIAVDRLLHSGHAALRVLPEAGVEATRRRGSAMARRKAAVGRPGSVIAVEPCADGRHVVRASRAVAGVSPKHDGPASGNHLAQAGARVHAGGQHSSHRGVGHVRQDRGCKTGVHPGIQCSSLTTRERKKEKEKEKEKMEKERRKKR